MSQLLYFVLGCAAEVALLLIARKFTNRKLHLEKRRDAVLELVNRPARIEAGSTELTAARKERRALQERAALIKQRAVDNVPLPDGPSAVYEWFAVAALLVCIEAAVFAVLTAPTDFLSLTGEVWAFLAPFIAVATVWLLHAVLATIIVDNQRPARTAKRARIGFTAFGVAVMCGIWAVLAGRNFSDPDLIERIVGVGLFALVGTLAVCSAFALVVAAALRDAGRPERESQEIDIFLSELERHIDLLERDLATQHGSIADEVRGEAPTAASRAAAASGIAVVSAVLAMAVALSAPVSAQAGPQFVTGRDTGQAVAPAAQAGWTFAKPTMAPGASPSGSRRAVTLARAGALEVLLDVTGSEERSPLRSAAEAIADNILAAADGVGARLVRISTFSGSPLIGIEEVALTPPNAITRCDAISNAASTRSIALELYPKARAAKAAADCAERIRSAEEVNARLRNAAAARIRTMLRRAAALAPRGPCTALHQAIRRALERSQHLVVVTDGFPTCAPGVLGEPSTLAPDACMIVAIVPSIEGALQQHATELLERIDYMQRAYPGSLAILTTEATPAFWQQVSCEGGRKG